MQVIALELMNLHALVTSFPVVDQSQYIWATWWKVTMIHAY